MSVLLETITFIKIGVQLVQNARIVVAEVRGDSKVLTISRCLMHALQMYEECLKTLQTTLNDKMNIHKTINNNNSRSTQYIELEKSVTIILTQIKGDCELLKKIFDETTSIEERQKKGIAMRIYHAFTDLANGKEQELKKLESELMIRVQIITSLMMKDVWKANNAMDEAIVDAINDVDGALFWCGNFTSEKSTTFRRFVEAYQSYIIQAFVFNRIERSYIITLLRYTLLDNAPNREEDLMMTEVSVNLFSAWIKRYGPMRDTLSKASCVSLPLSGRRVVWFQKESSRINAENTLSQSMAIHGTSGIAPDQLIIVRYSSDPKIDFVITTKSPASSIEHFTVTNSPLGYSIAGKDTEKFPNLLLLCQKQIIDKLFVPVVGANISLSSESMEQWSNVFQQAIKDFPVDHYKSIDDLEAQRARLQVDDIQTNGNTKLISFQSMFTDSSSSSTKMSSNISADVKPSESVIVGKYMVCHGLKLLNDSGAISVTKMNEILQSLDLI